jgi:hypothetical protein
LVSEKIEETWKKIREPLKPRYIEKNVIEDNLGEQKESAKMTDIEIINGVVRVEHYGLKEPVIGLPDMEVVYAIGIYKRLFLLMVSSIARQNIFGKVIIVLSLWLNMWIWADWFELIFQTYPIRLKEQYYLPVVKELRRVLKDKLPPNILDAISSIIENDNAYRYRLQDILVLLDKTQLTGYYSVKREVNRLIGIGISRDYDSMKEKISKIRKITGIILLVPSIRKLIVSALKEIDLEKVKMSKEEIYFTNRYGVYNYRGLDRETRKQENIKKYGHI